MKRQNHLDYVLAALLLAALGLQSCGSSSSLPTPTAAPAVTSSAPPASPGTLVSGQAPVDLPAQVLDHTPDTDSSTFAASKNVTSGDVFAQGFYERPFNANTMDTYFPHLDIVNFQGFMDATWGYGAITLQGADSKSQLSGEYAVELDLDKDGRGDWLIRASAPSSTSWSTQGVQAWKDTDGDVGGAIPMVADNKPLGGDGYETLVFDQGKGTLTDGAWARIDPNDPKTVQIAFKLSMLGNPTSFAMGAWAGANIDPSMFDYNDHMTHAQAGDPDRGYGDYPIKALAEIDNTCRLAMGFVPTSSVPGLCETAKRQVQNQPSCVPSVTAAGVPKPCKPPVIIFNPGPPIVNPVP